MHQVVLAKFYSIKSEIVSRNVADSMWPRGFPRGVSSISNRRHCPSVARDRIIFYLLYFWLACKKRNSKFVRRFRTTKATKNRDNRTLKIAYRDFLYLPFFYRRMRRWATRIPYPLMHWPDKDGPDKNHKDSNRIWFGWTAAINLSMH